MNWILNTNGTPSFTPNYGVSFVRDIKEGRHINASQIAGKLFVQFVWDKNKEQSAALLTPCKAEKAENLSISWRHQGNVYFQMMMTWTTGILSTATATSSSSSTVSPGRMPRRPVPPTTAHWWPLRPRMSCTMWHPRLMGWWKKWMMRFTYKSGGRPEEETSPMGRRETSIGTNKE